MSLHIPELGRLEPCEGCGHPRRNHHPRGCATNEVGQYEVRAHLNVCRCRGYKEELTMASLDNLETLIIDAVESAIDDIETANNIELPRMEIKPFRIPTDRTIVWNADDGSASVVLNPDTTVDVITVSKQSYEQLRNLTSALSVVQARLGIAILSRTVATSVSETGVAFTMPLDVGFTTPMAGQTRDPITVNVVVNGSDQ